MKEFVKKLMSMLEKQIFSAELYDYGWKGQTVHNLLCLGDVKNVAEQLLNEHEEQAEQYCYWLQQDEENSEVWLACDDKLFCLTNGTPSENGMMFCPYCGKNLVEITYEEQFPSTTEEDDDVW